MVLPSIHQEGRTAAQRLSRWAFLIIVEYEGFCGLLRSAHCIHSLQLLLIELVERQLDQADGVTYLVQPASFFPCIETHVAAGTVMEMKASLKRTAIFLLLLVFSRFHSAV